jgi:hypothetical protein
MVDGIHVRKHLLQGFRHIRIHLHFGSQHRRPFADRSSPAVSLLATTIAPSTETLRPSASPTFALTPGATSATTRAALSSTTHGAPSTAFMAATPPSSSTSISESSSSESGTYRTPLELTRMPGHHMRRAGSRSSPQPLTRRLQLEPRCLWHLAAAMRRQ